MYKLLIAEDIGVIRNTLVNSIDWSAHNIEIVGVAKNGKEAAEIFDMVTPDILLTDVKMPFMDGLELTKRVCQKKPAIQVIILTAYSDFAYAQNALRLGVVDFILKPIDIEELLVAVTKAISNLEEKRAGQKHNEMVKEIMNHSFPNLGKQKEVLSSTGNIKNKKIMESAMSYIRVNACSNITVEEVARTVNLNAKYMTTLYKQVTGESISKYIIRCKLEKAAELLRDPSIKVYEVCYQVGYSDQNYFRDIFIKYYGVSPSQYKNKIL